MKVFGSLCFHDRLQQKIDDSTWTKTGALERLSEGYCRDLGVTEFAAVVQQKQAKGLILERCKKIVFLHRPE